MRQYARFKRAHPGCILFFRMGDFYELFHEDAVDVSKALGLTLTERSPGVPMAGVPHHQLETYLRKMLEAGFRVAVCDQIQDPKDAKGVVERAVTRVVTPGTLVDEGLVSDDRPIQLASICFMGDGEDPNGEAAAAIVDLSTGRFVVLTTRAGRLADELARRSVSEVLYGESADGETPARAQSVLDALGVTGTPQPLWFFRREEALESLREQFEVATLSGFGLTEDDADVLAAGALVRHLRLTQALDNPDLAKHGVRAATLDHLQPPRRETGSDRCSVDATSLRSLEVVETIRGRSLDGSLLSVFHDSGVTCSTPMGRRLLRDWLCRPMRERDTIVGRHRAVDTLLQDTRSAEALREAIGGVQDIARIAGRIALRRATPRDLVGLGASLARVPAVIEAITGSDAFASHIDALERVGPTLTPLAEKVVATCVERPPTHMREGGLIQDGVDAELDECRSLQRDATEWLANYQTELNEQHDLPSLKVGYNKVFGYYIELPSAQAKRAPDVFTRKQTLKNAERYITPELKTFEEKVLSAEERATARELILFNALCDEAGTQLAPISEIADILAELDVLRCFASKAAQRGWVRPEMVDEPVLTVTQGRHPVLDELLGHDFVPNDSLLGVDPEQADAPGAHVALITGPNMAGKSTFIRQTALLVLLAHAGSFVPAEAARIGVTDQIFTRVGADDALHAGQSTFMVEMSETARILNHATGHSLVVLDEIGRGTSTLDGLSLAWAITEFLAKEAGPRCLFATHYHELTDLAERMPDRIRNLHVAVREWGDDIVFLHRILAGPTDQSYGVHVAKLAGVPSEVTARAMEVLGSLAVHQGGVVGAPAAPSAPTAQPSEGQMGLFTEFVPHPAVDRVKELKLEALTPLEAFDALRELKDLADR